MTELVTNNGTLMNSKLLTIQIEMM